MDQKPSLLKKCASSISHFFNIIGNWLLGFISRYWFWIILVIVTIFAIAARFACFPIYNGDTYWDIEGWVQFYRDNGGLAGLGQKPIGSYTSTLGNVPYWNAQWVIDQGGTITGVYKYANYPMGYLNLLALFSYLPISNLWVVKLVPTLFDFSFAIACFFVIHYITKNKGWALVAYCASLFLPTVLLNSAFWGQCDIMWAGLLVWVIYFFLKGKDWTAMAFLGLALSMKIMAIFFLPVLAWLWLNKRFKLRTLLIVPLVIFLTFIPCYIAGGDFSMPFSMYNLTDKAGEAVNLYSGSAYVFLEAFNLPSKYVNLIGLPLATGIIFLMTFLFWKSKVKVTPLSTLCMSAIMVILMPIVLPHMHDRFFLAGDILVFLFVVLYRKKIWLAVLMQISSFWACTHFLNGNKYLVPEIGRLNTIFCFALNLTVLIVLIVEFYKMEKVNKSTIICLTEKEVTPNEN